MTESEMHFESYCAVNGLIARRIEVHASERRPDFEVVGADGSVFCVEVKQFDPNAEEAEAFAALLAGQVRVTGGEPGARLRDAISDANQQIKRWAPDGVPGLLVVYRNEAASWHHTDPYSVLTAMRGLDVVPVVVPADPSEAPKFSAVRPGPKGRLTRQMNRSISAVAVLSLVTDADPRLDAYHNLFARSPLPITALAGAATSHFVLSDDRHRWEQVAA